MNNNTTHCENSQIVNYFQANDDIKTNNYDVTLFKVNKLKWNSFLNVRAEIETE